MKKHLILIIFINFCLSSCIYAYPSPEIQNLRNKEKNFSDIYFLCQPTHWNPLFTDKNIYIGKPNSFCARAELLPSLKTYQENRASYRRGKNSWLFSGVRILGIVNKDIRYRINQVVTEYERNRLILTILNGSFAGKQVVSYTLEKP